MKYSCFLLALAVLAASCQSPFFSAARRLPCRFNARKWQADVCGTDGYRKKMAPCLRSRPGRPPVFAKETEVLFYLGKPDTVYTGADTTHSFLYSVDGDPSCMLFFPDGILESLTVFMDKNGVVTGIGGGIH